MMMMNGKMMIENTEMGKKDANKSLVYMQKKRGRRGYGLRRRRHYSIVISCNCDYGFVEMMMRK